MSNFASPPGVPGPCPICGDVAFAREANGKFKVVCANCTYQTGWKETIFKAWRSHEKKLTRSLEEHYAQKIVEIRKMQGEL